MAKLTLGNAAKAAGISKPSFSAAIKKGRVSAEKNEKGPGFKSEAQRLGLAKGQSLKHTLA